MRTMIKINLLMLLFIICMIYELVNGTCVEGFTGSELKEKTNEIYDNKLLFNIGVPFTDIKKKIKWIDPVYFYDLYHLYINDNFNLNTISDILSH